MSNLRISDELSLPSDVITSTSVVFGGKGMGKTNLGSVIVEELTKAGLRWSFLDPMGVAWGLRHSKDGKAPGVECVILGGIHGDVPIDPTAGELVADLVVDESPNTIVDFSRDARGIPWSKGEKIKFITAYIYRLFRRQGEMVDKRRREPLLQILDEAARYIPQVIPHGSPQLAECVGAWEQAAEEGRNIGLGVMFLTQRSARINKSVSELADVMFAFRTVGPNSVEAIVDWLGEHMEKARARELAGQIRELDVGQCLVVSPGWLKIGDRIVQIRQRETFDSSYTPRPGEQQRRVTGPAAKPDLEKYKERLAAQIERAKQDDPKELRKRVAELERGAGVSGKEVQRLLDQEYARGVVDGSERRASATSATATWLDQQISSLAEIASRVKGISSTLLTELEAPPASKARLSARPPVAAKPEPVRKSAPAPTRTVAESNGAISKGEQRLLDALAELDMIGVERPTRRQAGAVAGLKLSAGAGSRYVARLIADGYVESPSTGVLSLTAQGWDRARGPAEWLTLQELHDRVLDKLDGGPRRILEYLISVHPTELSRAELGDAVGLSLLAGAGSRYVAKLTTLGFADIPRPGYLKAGDLLFPKALR